MTSKVKMSWAVEFVPLPIAAVRNPPPICRELLPSPFVIDQVKFTPLSEKLSVLVPATEVEAFVAPAKEKVAKSTPVLLVLVKFSFANMVWELKQAGIYQVDPVAH
ncbi:hypothetical protein [Roseovarius litorisediminis]|uniref:hypothetical protein n=1 Tax=Roseovarius litorisediminis TaxID=1312363 RepID=UPI001F392E39|nr:hypothetical protein [Roseovarius litorisediminis]